MCKVLNKHSSKDRRQPSVYIGRPSKWGNPFTIGRDGDRAQVILKYKKWIVQQPELIKAARAELRGKNLMCFCAPKACHGDVLMQIANSKEGDQFSFSKADESIVGYDPHWKERLK